ncbi:hypothetical protein [Streptomyces luteogriseus]|uniref:hypothetical protein n=1 Tax=Streptomyces luteogriseus TaxID=68233 RepID=UPI00372473FA
MKRSKNSSRVVKQQRQAKARAARRADLIVAGMTSAARLEAFPVVHEGQVRVLTAERIRARFEAELAADDEPPLDGESEFRSLLMDHVCSGALRLRRDGYWESDVDYFADAPDRAHQVHGPLPS